MGDRSGYQTDTERLKGYRQALAEAGIEFATELAVLGDGRPEGALAAVDGLLKLADPPTAVCCYNDMTALGAMRSIRARGLRVPDDVSVTGFDDLFFAEYLEPALTTVRQDSQGNISLIPQQVLISNSAAANYNVYADIFANLNGL